MIKAQSVAPRTGSGPRRLRSLVTLLVTFGCPCLAAGEAPPTLELVPADAVTAFYYAGPAETKLQTGNASAVALAALLADQAYEIGLLSNVDHEVRCWLDSLAALPEVASHPFTMALFSVNATERQDGGHQLSEIRGALIIKTDGNNAAIERRIRHLLQTYTNSDETKLTERKSETGTITTIRDRRLPDWIEISWGPVGTCFVATVGPGAFDRVVALAADRSNSLGNNSWMGRNLPRFSKERRTALLYARFDLLFRRAAPALRRKIERVRDSLGLRGAERVVWGMGTDGRSVSVRCVQFRDGRNVSVALAGKEFLADLPDTVIPDEATGFTVLNAKPGQIVDHIASAYLSSRSPPAIQTAREFWRMLEAESGVSFDEDLLGRLTGPVVVHNYPRHALNIPLLWTFVFPVKGDSEQLRASVDRLFESIRAQTAGKSVVQVQREPDGIWYMNLGLAGPALQVTDRWLIVSFSPQALRQNLAWIEAQEMAKPKKVAPPSVPE